MRQGAIGKQFVFQKYQMVALNPPMVTIVLKFLSDATMHFFHYIISAIRVSPPLGVLYLGFPEHGYKACWGLFLAPLFMTTHDMAHDFEHAVFCR